MNHTKTQWLWPILLHKNNNMRAKLRDLFDIERECADLLENEGLLILEPAGMSLVLVSSQRSSLLYDRADIYTRNYREATKLRDGIDDFGRASEWIESAA